MAHLPLPPYKKLLVFQLVVTLLLVAVTEVLWPGNGFSVLLGGLIALLPNGIFAFMVFRYRGARRVGLAVQHLFVGEMLKFGLTVVLFVLAFVVVQPSNPISLLIAYSVVLMVHWLAPMLLHSRR